MGKKGGNEMTSSICRVISFNRRRSTKNNKKKRVLEKRSMKTELQNSRIEFKVLSAASAS